MNVLSIVVTYNRKKLLEECLTSLINQEKTKTDILVIDNNSDDGTDKLVKKNFPDIYYENTGKNLGGAGGFNYGLKKAFKLEKKYDYIWIMDDDTIPEKNVLFNLLKVAKNLNDDFGFISPKTVWKDNKLCLMNRQSDLKGKLINENTEDLTKLSRCTFVACFLNVKAIEDVGLPIKEFFIWSDDTEYTLRISKKYSCYYLNSSKVIHKMNNNLTVKIEDDVEERIDRYYYLYRNRFYIAKKQGITKIIRYHLSTIKTIFGILLKSKNYKMKRISTVFKGYKSGLTFKPQIEYIS